MNIIPHGLINIGNTCWLNSLLQCIINLQRSFQIFNPCIKKPLHQLLLQLAENPLSNSTNILDQIVKHFQDTFTSGLPHDSSEAFLLLIDKLQKEEQSSTESYHSIHTFISKSSLNNWTTSQDNKSTHIYETFYSQIRYKLSDKTIRYEPMSIFPLHIYSSFADSFEELFKNKNITLLAPVMTIQIVNCKTIKPQLIADSFIIDCDGKKMLYKFNSCIYHLGHQDGGHYVSVVKIKHIFYMCNDNSISKIQDQSFFTKNTPILLFYISSNSILDSNSLTSL